MPVFTVNTNVQEVPADFKRLATETIARSLNKPVSHIAVQVNANQDLCFGATNEPAALCELVSIGALSRDSNKGHSKALMELLEQKLGVQATRVYISFRNTDKADIGFNKTTFDELL